MNRESHVSRFFKRFYLALILIFLYIPIVVLIVQSFNAGKSRAKWEGFSLHWYAELFQSVSIMNALKVTVSVAVIAMIVSTILGTLAAIGIYSMKKRSQAFMMTMTNLPNTMPDIVTGISLMLLFIFTRLERGYFTMLLAHITFNIPYVILSVMPKIRSLDPNLADAAMDLGATPWQALTKVIVPEIMPGVFSGALIAFTMSFDDFIISYFVTGRGVKNLSIMVYTMSKRVNPTINAISSLIVGVITLVLVIINLVPFVRERLAASGKQEGGAVKGQP